MLQLNIIVITMLLFCAFTQQQESKYSDKYDHVAAQDILSNKRLRDRYYDCFIGDGLSACKTEDAKFFKGIIFEAIITKCKRCTEAQKKNLDETVSWYYDNEPERWHALVRKAISDTVQKKSL